MRISDWSSDVCSSDLCRRATDRNHHCRPCRDPFPVSEKGWEAVNVSFKGLHPEGLKCSVPSPQRGTALGMPPPKTLCRRHPGHLRRQGFNLAVQLSLQHLLYVLYMF